MRLFNKVAALLLAVTLAVPTMSVAAAETTTSPQTQAIKGVDASGTYDGSDQSSLIKFTDDAGTELTVGTDYEITNIDWTGSVGSTKKTNSGANLAIKNAGTYVVTAAGKGNYDGPAEATITIAKATPTLTASKSSFTYQMYKVYNTKLSATVKATSNSDGAITYSLTKYGINRGFSINASTGVVTHPKNATKKYKVGDATVKASVAETLNYKAVSKKVATITIKKSYPHIGNAVGKTKNQNKTIKASTLASKAVTYTLTKEPGVVVKAEVKTGSKYITVSGNGKITVKKGTPKGKYKIQVYNTNTSQYYKGAKNCYVIVK